MVLCYLKSFITDVFSTKKIKIIHRIPLLILNLLNELSASSALRTIILHPVKFAYIIISTYFCIAIEKNAR